ncbi:GNAT family N-acetyltransferase [Streptomyces sp. JJ36]|uniref:GNAT family N-acetyltransferase n=1 Tax=Streptomyces sp. JJ36 TaxID=2736645 RepID=UPI001F4563C1|nr:GNAT family N-acetyltransferase [Streptomyces sp. JJ36]MCF6524182.1 GNAT family N-acetyltransferase [Streptomyces sp. JJ36]
MVPLTDPAPSATARRSVWLATDPSRNPVGTASLRLFSDPGRSRLAELDLRVHPAERRRGVGSRLLGAAVAAARADGRCGLLAEAPDGSDAAAFLAARGFRRALGLTYARLPLAEADTAALTRLAAQPCPGYRLAYWDGTVPAPLAASFAASRRAMDDMPMGGTGLNPPAWDVERVRAAAEAVARRGDLLSTVVALDATDGTVAGFSELVVPGDGRGDGLHHGTAVLPGHRGRGLARWMKAAVILRARERHPRLEGLCTDTADENAPMRRVNDALGYRPTHRAAHYRLDLR